MVYPFVVIEGIDGAGKTTIAQFLSHLIGAAYVKTPVGAVKWNRNYIDKLDPLPRFLYYVADLAEASQLITENLLRQPVVCDRYHLSTILNHQAMGVPVGMVDFSALQIVKPMAVVYLWAEESIIVARLQARSEVSSHIHLERDRQLQQAVHQLFLRQGGIHSFNTGSYRIEEMPQLAEEIKTTLGL